MQSEANMLRAIQRLVALLKRPRDAAEEYRRRHQLWDRECRARGMTVREQADELQVRCAWVRLRRKASGAVLRRPERYREILNRIADDESRTLIAIGGEELARVFRRTFEATDPLEILSFEAASTVRAHLRTKLAPASRSPSLVPDLPAPARSRASNDNRSRTRPRAPAF